MENEALPDQNVSIVSVRYVRYLTYLSTVYLVAHVKCHYLSYLIYHG